MANSYINVYKNNPTAGATDGTPVSTDGDFTAPISFTLDASIAESQKQKLAVRTESGYIATDVTISDLNDTNDRLKLCATENGIFTDTLEIGNVSSLNTVFWAQASSSSTETPQVDTSASFRISGVIATVG